MSIFSDKLYKFLLVTGVVLFFFIEVQYVYAPPPPPTVPTYTISAHGNTTYGVNRPRTAGFGYSRGNCAHCHEQHASIGGQTITAQGYELFYDHWVSGSCDLFCYKCHNNTLNLNPEMQVTNYLFGVSFGGYPLTASWDSMYEQFCDPNIIGNCGSRHDLDTIRSVLISSSWGYPADPDPCSGCHNPHFVQRIGSKQYQGPYNPDKSPISRPSEHTTNPTNLWGDDYQIGCPSGENERMICYAQSVSGNYQAPYYGDTSGSYFEPSGNSSPTDGSDLPDYVSLCLDCHIVSVGGRKAIDWGTTGDKHGGRVAEDVDCGVASPFEIGASLRNSGPYNNSLKSSGYNYVLSCTDCHEPHGTPNRVELIRRFINGEPVPADAPACFSTDTAWLDICQRCHTISGHVGGCNTGLCHGHGRSMNCGTGNQRTF